MLSNIMIKNYKSLLGMGILLLLFSCAEDPKQENKTKQANNIEAVSTTSGDALFSQLNPSQTKIHFMNTVQEDANRHLGHYDYMYNGSGVAIGDINNDGLADVFFTGSDASNRLYLNKGNFEFEDISKKAGIITKKWSTGVSMADINEDGFLDIYVCNSGPEHTDDKLANQLFINNGNLTFTEQAAKYGLDDKSHSSQAGFFDMDKDGDLDLFVMNHSLFKYAKTGKKNWEDVLTEQSPEVYKKSCSTLYRNEGNGKFKDISKEAGIFRPGFGLGLSLTDLNNDGATDIYVANDYFVPDFYFVNQGNGTFVENVKTKASHTSFYSMGCDAADFNNDGLIDLAVVDMTPSDHFRSKTLMESMNVKLFSILVEEKKQVPQYMFNTLSLNRGKANLSEIAHLAGVAKTDWSWAALLVDMDNDAKKDFIVTNGFKRDTKDQDWLRQLNEVYKKEGKTSNAYFKHLNTANSVPLKNYIYQNNGNLKFEDKSNNWGFTEPSFSNGAAYGDLDNDGDLDLVVNNLDSKAFVYRNNTRETNKANYLQLTLTDGKSSAKALNAKVKLYAEDNIQLLEYTFVRGYLSDMQALAHFGLGKTDNIDKVEIYWPDGTMSTITNPTINQRIVVDKQKIGSQTAPSNNTSPWFMDIAPQAAGLNYKHQENKFNDFEKEILLPHKQSTLGPSLCVGDINADGLDDFYVGGAKGQSGELYLQTAQGLNKSKQPAFEKDKASEDLAALFFDADKDGDLDLYVASGGGGDFKENSPLLQDRLYLNTGDGNFKKSANALPKMITSTACVEVSDWDADGDLDLFIGGRNTPGKYPLSPKSYLLINEKGKFKDATAQLASDLQNIGMVTSATWSDLNKDGLQDLIVVGEWMPITCFLNTKSGFKNVTNDYGLTDSNGWWYSIDKGDFDNDGDEDFIVGNLGLNNKFQPKKGKPLNIFANDFDDNGSLDIVLSKEYKGELAPVRGKECSTEQMPFLAEKFPSYADFASSTLTDIYGKQNLEDAVHFEVSDFSSIYLENKGNGAFEKHALPNEAQISPIKGMVILDFDKDGQLDLVIGGNMYDTEVETPAYDAGKGLFLKGNGNGTFSPQTTKESGIFLPNNLKKLALFKLAANRPAILAANNNGKLNLFAWTK